MTAIIMAIVEIASGNVMSACVGTVPGGGVAVVVTSVTPTAVSASDGP
jgi:hypothetical protein